MKALYMDFRKAFDSVNHQLVVAKQRAYGIADNVCRWIEEFLLQRTFNVTVSEPVSTEASA